MRRIALPLLVLSVIALAPTVRAMTEAERRDYLDQLLKTLPPVSAASGLPSFGDWVQAKGILPPDFGALPRHNGLPDPLKFLDGRDVKTAADWAARRKEIWDLEQKYQLGTVPPKPQLDKIVPVSETTNDAGVITRTVNLQYGPDDQASAQVSVTIPAGEGPFPVLIGGMGAAVLNRGYIACSFPSSVDTPSNLPQLYPGFDFATMGQRAFTARMVVDYLYTLPQVDKARIAITGYSRGGKMAMFSAALDERIAAVVAGSTGVGGVVSWRQAGERNQAESIETTTRMFPLWFAPQLRFFAGREDRLPVDGNLLVTLIAPRSCLIEYGMNDEVSNTWADEQSLYSALPVFKLLGQPEHVSIMRIKGVHGTDNIEMDLDWLDIQFGRSKDKWVNNFLYPWNLNQWVAKSGEKADLAKFPAHKPDDLLVGTGGKSIASVADWETKAADIRQNINWLLGDAPATIPPAYGPADKGTVSAHGSGPARGGGGPRAGAAPGAFGARGSAAPGGPAASSALTLSGTGTLTLTGGNGGPGAFAGGARGGPVANPSLGSSISDDIKSKFTGGTSNEFGWTDPQRGAVTPHVITFGEGVKGDLYVPNNTPAGTKLPTVIWLHGFSYPLGYMWVYRRDLHPILALTQAGYAVLAYDQCGFSTRATELAQLFDTAPHWSQMGRLVHDARSAIDALSKDSVVDADHIYIFGYELGAMTGLYTAALDSRVKGVVAVNGFKPMRTDTEDKGTGGIARWSVERPLLPRLGFFIGHESQIPVDYTEILAAIAPRPVVVVAPLLDRDVTQPDVHAALEQARKVYALYQKPNYLMVGEPWDYARFPGWTQDWTIQSLNWAAGPAAPKPATAPTAAN